MKPESELAGAGSPPPEASAGKARESYFRWGFFSASAVILALIVAGEMFGRLVSAWPPVAAILAPMRGQPAPEVLASMGARDWVFAGFLLSATGYFVLQRAALGRFFRSMHVGVSLVSLTTLAVLVGVLVPQIQNFEDPEERVTAGNYEANYTEFRWAEAYFLYHMLHPYGIGMPKADPEALEVARKGLERYALVYGAEEARNRRKLMEASFTGSEKSDAISAFAKRNDAKFRKAFDVATALQLNRLYKSNWFASLLFLVATGVLYNTFKGGWRRWFTIGKVGFVVTHAGILILLAGGFVSSLFTDRGLLELELGEPARDTYFRHYRTEKLARMPFSLRLEHFARKEWKALEIWPLTEEFSSRVPMYTLWEDRAIPFDFQTDDGEVSPRPRLEVRVKSLHDHARVGFPKVAEGGADDGEGPMPGIELEVPNVQDQNAAHMQERMLDDGPTRRVFLSPVASNQGYFDPSERFRLVVVHDAEPSQVLTSDLDEVLGTLDIEVQGTSNPLPQSVRFRMGQRIPLAGGYELEVVDATKDLRKSPDRESAMRGSQDPRPLAQQPDGYAAVWVDIHPPDGDAPERRVVVEMIDPIEYGLQVGYENKQVVVRLRWDRWSSPGPARYVLAWGADKQPTLTSEEGTTSLAEVGKPLELPGADVVPLGFYERARFEKRLEFLPNQIDPDGWDRSFYSRDARGAVLEVVSDPGTKDERVVEEIRMATTRTGSANLWITPDRRYGLKFLENIEGFPFDWRSVLAVEETDGDGRAYTKPLGPPKKREIRVNDYFQYNGYRFFQTNADPSRPKYSGIGVVYDPGIPLVLIGMYTIIAGACLAFLFRPIVLARKRREAQAS